MKAIARRAGLILGVVVASATMVSAAGAATFVVDRSDDGAAVSACTPAPNDCNLRGAVNAAADPAADIITFDPTVSLVTLLGASNENLNATGDLDIVLGSGPITIRGNGADKTTIDADGVDRVFDFVFLDDVTIENIRLTGGIAGAGGCIQGQTMPTDKYFLLRSVQIDNCSATQVSGGGAVYWSGSNSSDLANVSIVDSWILDSETTFANANGGAVHASDSDVIVLRSTFSGNHQGGGAAGVGGAITAADLDIRNSTFFANRADGNGSAASATHLSVYNSTFVSNIAGDDGNGGNHLLSVNLSNPPTISNSIMTDNAVGAGLLHPNCSTPAPASSTNNLVKSVAIRDSCGYGSSTVVDISFGVPTFQAMGSLLSVLPLNLGDLAVDAGDPSGCAIAEMVYDNRGGERSVGTCDIGAYELGGLADLALTSTNTTSPTLDQGQSATVTATVKNNGPDLVPSGTLTVTLPAGLTVSGASSNGVACTGSGTLSCAFTNLNVDAQIGFSSTVTGASAGTYSVGLQVDSPGRDLESPNDNATVGITVSSPSSSGGGGTDGGGQTTTPTSPSLVVRGRSFKMTKSGRMVLPVRCDGAGGARCQVALNLTTTKRFAGKRKWRIACAAVNPVVGRSVQVKCKLPSKFRQGVRSSKSVKVKLAGTVKVGTDRRAISPITLTLKR